MKHSRKYSDGIEDAVWTLAAALVVLVVQILVELARHVVKAK